MLQLPNNCRAGSFSVNPANWKSQSAKVKSIWRISYWFYDDNLNKKHKVVIKGMNRLTTLQEKQQYVRDMIDYETDLLQNRGWNYITETESAVIESELSPHTPVIPALEYALSKVEVEPKTFVDIKGCLGHVTTAIQALRFDRHPISGIRRKHLKLVFEKVAAGKPRWTNNTFNHYRKYLAIIFRELIELEAVDSNPVRDMQKKKVTRRIRLELTKGERKLLREKLPASNPRFWIFLNIFHHSSSRETEMMRLRVSDIDLPGQRFKVTVKKGKNPREEWRPIKDIAVPYWEQALIGARETDYVFSVGLKPGPKKIRADQITKRFSRVKKKFGIKADIYSLKYSNLDEMAAAMEKHKEAMNKAAEVAGHSAVVVTMGYTQGELARQHETQKKVWNEL